MMQTLLVEDGHPGDTEIRTSILRRWNNTHFSARCIYSTVEQEAPYPFQTDQFHATVLKSRSDWYLSKDIDYKSLIDADKSQINLDMFLTEFLSDFIELQENKPYWIHCTSFNFPGEEYIEPMVVFHFYSEDPVDEILF
jgi:hypothetical protein